MEKVKLGRNVSVYPMPVVLVGAMVEGRPNFMTVAWVSRVNATPPLLAVSLNKPRYTARGIRENKTFSLSVPSANIAEKVDYCGLVSGRDEDKSKLFEVFYGDLGTAPMIRDCPLSLECRLYDVHELPTNDLFIGEVVEAYIDRGCFVDGRPEVRMMNPLLLTMPDNRYWLVGDYAGDAWSTGKGLKSCEG
jgi:flavin reductase (DIM6/NTAB) family NADH-FMN oxidoreductase RutF